MTLGSKVVFMETYYLPWCKNYDLVDITHKSLLLEKMKVRQINSLNGKEFLLDKESLQLLN